MVLTTPVVSLISDQQFNLLKPDKLNGDGQTDIWSKWNKGPFLLLFSFV
jgi:hypothetical protein